MNKNALKINYNENIEIQLNIKTNKLYFIQATDINGGRLPWQSMNAMGEYEIIYEDGSTLVAPIYYGRDINEYHSTYCYGFQRANIRKDFGRKGLHSLCTSVEKSLPGKRNKNGECKAFRHNRCRNFAF